jgi:hypothetical protein
MRSEDDYERIRTVLTEVAMGQSNALDRERWFALALACSGLEVDEPTRDAERSRAGRDVRPAPGKARAWVPSVLQAR